MRPRHPAVAVLTALAVPALAACGDAPYVRSEATALAADIGELDGVSDSTMAYDDLGGWEHDEITFTATMSAGATDAQVADAVAASYELVLDQIDDDAASTVRVVMGDDAVETRIFDVRAGADDVGEAAALVLPERHRGRLLIRLDAQDYATSPSKVYTYLNLRLSVGATKAQALAVQAELRDGYPSSDYGTAVVSRAKR